MQHKKMIKFLISFFVLTLAMPAQAYYLEAPKRLLDKVRALKRAPAVILVTEGQTGPTEEGQPGSQMGQPQMEQGQPGSQMGQPQMGPGGEGFEGQQGGESDEEREKRDRAREEQELKRIKRELRQMLVGVNKFELMVKNLEKKGTAVPAEVKEKLERIKTIINAIMAAGTMEELQAAGAEELGELMQSLDQVREELFEKAQRVEDMKRGLRGMEGGLKMFERQIAQLQRQKIAVPQEVLDTLNKVKVIIAAVKSAKTWEEMEAAGIEELGDLMQSLDEARQQLEILSRWPQTLKQVNRELARVDRELRRAKSIVDRLLKRGIDLTAVYAEFEAAVGKLKTVKDEAVNKMNAGDPEGAFDALENDFFGQLEDTWQNHRVIMMMSNLGRFQSDFKNGIRQAKRVISNLKRRKIDTSELESLVAQAEAKGQEVLNLMKVKPIDEEAIMEQMQELENLRQAFEQRVDELTGEEEDMPWEGGPEIFKKVSLPSNVERIIPKKEKAQPEEGPSGEGQPGF